MNNNIDVSIIIGCYNGIQDTKNCIESVIGSEIHNQTKIDKIFVHSNGSTDGTQDMLLKLSDGDGRIVPIISNFPLGYARAFNFPMQFCNTEYIVCLNNDTEVGSNWLDILMNNIVGHDGIGVSSVMWISEKNNFFGGECYVTSKTTLAKLGLLNESFDVAYGEDHEFSLRLHSAGMKCVATSSFEAGKDGRATINFPMNHKSNQTTALFGDVRTRIDKNTKKVEFIRNATGGRYLIVLNKKVDEKFLHNTVNTIISVDPESVVLVTSNNFIQLGQIHDIQEMYGLKNVFIVPHIFGDGTQEDYEKMAGIFFDNKAFKNLPL